MKYLTCIFLFFFCLKVLPQKKETWYSFMDKKSELIGFKNRSGSVVIKPRFTRSVCAKEFVNVVGVQEQKGTDYDNYYLTKSGKKFGVGNLYVYNYLADCEYEQHIRYKDKSTGYLGMYNVRGKVVIPAIYNYLSRMDNGLVRALKGAKKDFLGHKEKGCDHYIWNGGKKILLDKNNKVLINGFDPESDLNYYSIEDQLKPTKDEIRLNFKGVNGKYYTFIDYEKEFLVWLKTKLIPNLSYKKLSVFTYNNLMSFTGSGASTKIKKSDFLAKNYKAIKEQLGMVYDEKVDFFVSISGDYPFKYGAKNKKKYFNTCGEPNREKYPSMDLIINIKVNGRLIQNHIEFLRTDKGYKLFNALIRTK